MVPAERGGNGTTPTDCCRPSTVRHELTRSDIVLRVEQPKPTKRSLTVRLAATGYTRIAERAHRADIDVSHMVRRMLAYADQHMPDTWVPPRPDRHTPSTAQGR
jgi:hypothetical protein